jgi:hypothetical protein
MALRAVDVRVLWRRIVEPARGRFAFAARLALACAITAVLTALYQTPSPALTAYVAFFVNKPDRMETVVLCIVMTLLITVILGFTTLVADLVLDSSGWRVAAMTTISFGLLFLVSASKLRPIGGIVALIVAYALDVLGSVRTNDLATRTLLYPWLFVATPAAVSLVLALLVAPSPRRLVERELARGCAPPRRCCARRRRRAAGARAALHSGNGEVGAPGRRARARRAPWSSRRCGGRPMPRSPWSRPWTSWRARRSRCSRAGAQRWRPPSEPPKLERGARLALNPVDTATFGPARGRGRDRTRWRSWRACLRRPRKPPRHRRLRRQLRRCRSSRRASSCPMPSATPTTSTSP